MSGPVNVLVWLDAKVEREWEIERATGLTNDAREPAMAVRAAVAELIEADKEYDTAITALSDLNRKVAEQGWLEIEHDALRNACTVLVRAQARRIAALENVGGAK